MTLAWLNEPPRWHEADGVLTVTTGSKTDFWARTFYGFVRDNGHFRYQPVRGDFTAEVSVSADYHALYDQAGLMLRGDASNWLKTGIEFTDGAVHFSTVVTRDGYSDWSQQKLTDAARDGIGVRVTRHGEAVRVQFRLGNGVWQAARLAMLRLGGSADMGMMCCTPEREGLEVTFSGFHVGPPISRDLHAD